MKMDVLKIQMITLVILCFNAHAESTLPSSLDDILQFDDTAMQESQNISRSKRQILKGPDGKLLVYGLPVIKTFMYLACSSFTELKQISCTINVKSLDIKHALILDPRNRTKLHYPDASGNIVWLKHQTVLLSCGMNGNTFKLLLTKSYAMFACACDDQFASETGRLYKFHQLTCQNIPQYQVHRKKDNGLYRRYEIGFAITEEPKDFVKVISVHQMIDYESTVFVKSVIQATLDGGQETDLSIPYDSNFCCIRGAYTSIMGAAFDEDAQVESFRNQIWSEILYEYPKHYLKPNTSFVLDRSYLTPRHSMIYAVEALATYDYLNVVPQWKIIKSHNWECIEKHVSLMARITRDRLLVYTGVYGRLKLEDLIDGNNISMFLHAAKNQREDRNFPIPLYNFKIVLSEGGFEDRGIVYVTVNNPYIKPGFDYVLCKRPFTTAEEAFTPTNWQPENVEHGYSYMCSVKDFSKEINIDFDSSHIFDKVKDLFFMPHIYTEEKEEEEGREEL